MTLIALRLHLSRKENIPLISIITGKYQQDFEIYLVLSLNENRIPCIRLEEIVKFYRIN